MRFEGGGINSFIMMKRNRSNNDETDRFYDIYTGQENAYLRYWAGWDLWNTHDAAFIIYIRGYLNSPLIDTEEESWKDW